MDQLIPGSLKITKEERTSILRELKKNYKKQTPLPYQYQPQPQTQKSQKIQYVYKAHNAHHNRKVSPQIIMEKLHEYQNESPLEREEEKQIQEIRQYRYYDDKQTCTRCARFGHSKNLCPFDPKCLFCLSTSHRAQKCPQKNICFRCFQLGHSNTHCTIRQHYQQCLKCERNHGSKCHFLAKGKQKTKKMFNMDSLYSNPSLRCIRCGHFGHLMCNR